MIERTITVNACMEARPSALFVQAASKFKSTIYVTIDNKTVNGKSIMGIISIGIREGQQVVLTADGEDAQVAIDELDKFLSSFN